MGAIATGKSGTIRMINDATRDQNEAARPDRSTWLTANAGSGKTRVLINRVARLLLNGTEPQNILCLTYTKAAASEMQNRLFKTLGHWAMLDEKRLRQELSQVGEKAPTDLTRARTLFAGAIEAPGGLKIQTIHSFCSKILRQFPLEAGVSPQFDELDERQQQDLLKEVIDDVARLSPGVIERVRFGYSGETLTNLAREICKNAELFSSPRGKEAIFEAFKVAPDQTVEEIASETLTPVDLAFLKSLVPMLGASNKKMDQILAEHLRALPNDTSPEALLAVQNAVLTNDRSKVSSRLITKAIAESPSFAPLAPEFSSICDRVLAAHDDVVRLEAAELASALDEFAHAILPRYAKLKATKGQLDFDDLIRLTKRLLTTRSFEWVLYRLDSRIEHILVDEAQDTSPMQWDVIEALTNEMTSGADDRNRTFFVVGDKKQSIYSFQGADSEGFERRADAFERQLVSGSGLKRRELVHSFRSSSAILRTVDEVFSTQTGAGQPTRHFAFHTEMPGRVDLWPLVPKPAKNDMPPWYDLSNRTIPEDASQQLADAIACQIEELLKTGTIQDESGDWRRITANDFMILVQRRSALFDRIISSCKSRNLPIAGADRLKVGSELAVRDVLALLSFLALPEDDLSLATALRSPLVGWSEQQLFNLAAGRKEKVFLWQEMRNRRTEFAETFQMLTLLRGKVDFLRPFELIDLILTEYGGRSKLLQRLGSDAEDGLDELLNQSLAYERREVPSLTGFLAFAKASDIDVKREAEKGELIRVMTVHGAKGLESPIVILPDTTFSRPRSGQDILEGPEGIPVLPRGKTRSPDVVLSLQADKRQRDEAERDRLLYVAMTRAERWLIVCGTEQTQSSGEKLNWHERIEDGLRSLGADSIQTPTGSGLRFSAGNWSKNVESNEFETTASKDVPEIPEFGRAAQPSTPVILSPSKMGGDKVLVGEPGVASGGARKGRLLHLLLERLPGLQNPLTAATSLLSRGPDTVDKEEVAELVKEAKAVFAAYPHVFGRESLAEVEIVADIPTLGSRVSGAIDRLVVSDERVLAVDFKTNTLVPKVPYETPIGILRQMGAYLEGLEAIYPNRKIDVAILWTETGELMELPHGIVRAALQAATTS